ncbi:MAG: PilZ domain-containing protein [Candidatus Electrothrix sp. GW3-4]|uniref:PilZ domain-containing protein n=1 Tax=Candidatus Electrothrix sp. GW3-4 TaxID=3126740 RepID=UPI0030CF721F
MLNNQETKQHRINELKIKIYYTETVRDNYKNKHPSLYETNSYYLEKLHQELEELEKLCKDMDNSNQRKFSRVAVQRPVRLHFSAGKYNGFIDNLSLCGSFVKGSFKQSKGDICKIDFKESARDPAVAVRAIGSITRINESGIALEFIAMKPTSYHWLETELLSQAPDPSVLEDEIFQRSIFELDDDLVYSSLFNCNRNKLKKLLDLP